MQNSFPSPMSSAGSAPRQLTSQARLAVLGAVLLALFLGSLDQTMVGTALEGGQT